MDAIISHFWDVPYILQSGFLVFVMPGYWLALFVKRYLVFGQYKSLKLINIPNTMTKHKNN
jgi:hypothetical protein